MDFNDVAAMKEIIKTTFGKVLRLLRSDSENDISK